MDVIFNCCEIWFSISFVGQDANIAGREDDAASRAATQGGVSRYNTETVNINLGTATVPVGRAVEIP